MDRARGGGGGTARPAARPWARAARGGIRQVDGGAADAWVDYIHRGRREARLLDLRFGVKRRLTPLYFPSVSSSSQRSSMDAMVAFCADRGAPQLLVSAYDLGTLAAGTAKSLEGYVRRNVLLLDSGAFEAHYAGREWGFAEYAGSVQGAPCDIYAGYDEMPNGRQTNAYMLRAARTNTGRSAGVAGHAAVCMAVLHGGTGDQLACVAEAVVQGGGGPRMYAVPEREMGGSLAEKIRTAVRIRRALSGADPRNVLHVLGCGDPVLMALLAYAGADCFDSVDWSRWAVNPETLEWTCADRLEGMGCGCGACAVGGAGTLGRMWGHNLLFYERFTGRLRDMIHGDRDFGEMGDSLGGRLAEVACEAFGAE